MKMIKAKEKTNPAMAPTVWIGALVDVARPARMDASLRQAAGKNKSSRPQLVTAGAGSESR